jgi:lipase maturation factor 1
MNTAPEAGPRPVVLYDGECAFCTAWARHWQARLGPRIDFLPAARAAEIPFVPPDLDLESALHFVSPDGTIHRGAQAVLAVWAASGQRRFRLALARHLPGFTWAAEAVYRFVAAHRHWFAALARRL